MGISFDETKDDLYLVMEGAVGIEEARTLLARLKDDPLAHITVDMTDLKSTDTTIVQILLSVKEASKKRGTTLRVINPHELIMEALYQVGFGAELTIN